MSIDDIEFVDAVFSIPKNAVRVEFSIETYEQGEMHTVKGVFDPADIRDAINLFDEIVAGEYPKYVATEKGRAIADLMDTGLCFDDACEAVEHGYKRA